MTTSSHTALANVKPDWDFWGIINTEGRYVLDPVYKDIHPWREGLARVVKNQTRIDTDGSWKNHYNGQYGYVTPEGRLLTEYFGYAEDFSNGLAAVNRDKKWGFIDKTGQLVIPFGFDQVHAFTPHDCIVCLHGKWGMIDRQGRWKLENRFTELSGFAYGLAIASEKSLTGAGHTFVVDEQGNRVLELPRKWKWYTPVSEKLLLFGTGSGYPGERFYGFMDLEGNIKSEPRFYTNSDRFFYTELFHEGKLYVETKDGERGYVDEEGLYHPEPWNSPETEDDFAETATPSAGSFDEVLDYAEGLAVARKGSRWGIIDEEHRTVTDFIYQRRIGRSVGDTGLFFSEYFPQFRCGLLDVCEERDTIYSGYIDRDGEIAIPLRFRIAEPFSWVDGKR